MDIFLFNPSPLSFISNRVGIIILTGFNDGIQANGTCEPDEERVSDHGEKVSDHCKGKQGPPV